ncbi:MAG: DUF2946 domain-containing protein [Burkholderiales bacterium]|nr:DUF2946 domain-containing protein [Burkholderiales bacterium]
MLLLQALRQSRIVARFVLAWFVLSLAVAIAAPVVNPQSATLVCSATGVMKLVGSGGEELAPPVHHSLDCVLCLALNTPPALTGSPVLRPPSLTFELQPVQAAFVVWRTASPLSARGPPLL